MKNRKGLAWLIAALAVLSFLAAGCGSSDSGSDGSSSKDTTTSGASKTDTEGYGDLKAEIKGQGSSLQDTFQQQVSSDFGGLVKDAGGTTTVTYTKTASKDGKKALADKQVAFAGSDSTISDEEKPNFGDRDILYFPIVGGPVTVSYNLKGVDSLNLSPDTIAKIFQAEITSWDDPAIAKENPDATLPSTKITVVHRSDGSGTTKNFTKFLVAAAPDTWKLDAGDLVLAPKTGDIQSVETFGDAQIHMEWMAPVLTDNSSGQNRSNTGVYIQGRYEVQILDSHTNTTYSNGQAGSIYKQYAPLVNPARPAGEWQTYDIVFIAPRFAPSGALVSPARVTVFFNGVLVQNNVELKGSTVFRGPPSYVPHGPGPLLLQDHKAHEIRFRNIWVRRLD